MCLQNPDRIRIFLLCSIVIRETSVDRSIRSRFWARASLFRRFTDTNVYGTGSVKIWKTRHAQNIRGCTDNFYSALLLASVLCYAVMQENALSSARSAAAASARKATSRFTRPGTATSSINFHHVQQPSLSVHQAVRPPECRVSVPVPNSARRRRRHRRRPSLLVVPAGARFHPSPLTSSPPVRRHRRRRLTLHRSATTNSRLPPRTAVLRGPVAALTECRPFRRRPTLVVSRL